MLLHADRQQAVSTLRHWNAADGNDTVRAELNQRRLQRRRPDAANTHTHATIANTTVTVVRPRRRRV